MRSGVLVFCALALGGTVAPRRARAQVPPVQSASSSQIEGRITIARAINGGTPGSSANAVFSRSSLWGTRVASDGPCTVYKPAATDRLSAGTITITGTVQPITLDERRATSGVEYVHAASVPDPAFADGATIKVDASGGSDVPAFSASVNAPPELAGYAPPSSLARRGYTATWTASPGTEIMIVVGALSRRWTDGLIVMCRVADTGTFTLPASTFALIPPAFDQAIVTVGRVAETVQAVGGARIAVEAVSSVGSGPVSIGPAAAPPSTAPCETTPRLYLSVALGLGGVSRNGDVRPTAGSSWRFQLGQRLRHGLHLVEEINTLGGGNISSYPIDTTEGHVSIGAGIRWTPFEPRPQRPIASAFILPGRYIDLRAFTLTAVLGANLRDRYTQTSPTGSMDETAWSPMASLALGLLELQGHDWSLGPEFREQLAYYDGNLQRGWMMLMAIHLNEW